MDFYKQKEMTRNSNINKIESKCICYEKLNHDNSHYRIGCHDIWCSTGLIINRRTKRRYDTLKHLDLIIESSNSAYNLGKEHLQAFNRYKELEMDKKKLLKRIGGDLKRIIKEVVNVKN